MSEDYTLAELREMASELGIPGRSQMSKEELWDAIDIGVEAESDEESDEESNEESDEESDDKTYHPFGTCVPMGECPGHEQPTETTEDEES